jgi:hypothetical protein
MRADFTGLAVEDSPSSRIAYRIRRCTGFWPSHTSGSARPFTTDIA